MGDFFDQYRTVHWQKKSFFTINDRDWRCQWCGAEDRPLQTHHGYYEANKKVWQYEDDTLWVLCDPCHNKANKAKRAVHRALARIHPKHLEELTGRIEKFGRAINKPPAEGSRVVAFSNKERE